HSTVTAGGRAGEVMTVLTFGMVAGGLIAIAPSLMFVCGGRRRILTPAAGKTSLVPDANRVDVTRVDSDGRRLAAPSDRAVTRRPAVETANVTGTREALDPGRLPLFCDTSLAGRIEEAEAQLIAGCCRAARHRTGTEGFTIPIAGGVASFAGPGSP